ncbi:uncharacterized protein LOC143018636 isoform X1 [Oratosquilla oratoria]|uniref:uncharacterized protein LOC143018636 isoform X1 n=1 Tax=Oratosquilla oratoria TaxID=337810 RepID=UPI003F76D179
MRRGGVGRGEAPESWRHSCWPRPHERGLLVGSCCCCVAPSSLPDRPQPTALVLLRLQRSAARTCLSVAVRPQTRRRHRRCRRPQPPPATSRAEWAAPATQASLQASQSVSVKCCTAGDS